MLPHPAFWKAPLQCQSNSLQAYGQDHDPTLANSFIPSSHAPQSGGTATRASGAPAHLPRTRVLAEERARVVYDERRDGHRLGVVARAQEEDRAEGAEEGVVQVLGREAEQAQVAAQRVKLQVPDHSGFAAARRHVGLDVRLHVRQLNARRVDDNVHVRLRAGGRQGGGMRAHEVWTHIVLMLV
eukprot:227243-Chlamydomonas_euryale.AAC.12